MYKKYIRYIWRVPFSVCLFFLLFFFLCCKVFTWGNIIFSKTELAEVGEAPQCYKFSTDFVVFFVVAMTTSSD